MDLNKIFGNRRSGEVKSPSVGTRRLIFIRQREFYPKLIYGRDGKKKKKGRDSSSLDRMTMKNGEEPEDEFASTWGDFPGLDLVRIGRLKAFLDPMSGDAWPFSVGGTR